MFKILLSSHLLAYFNKTKSMPFYIRWAYIRLYLFFFKYNKVITIAYTNKKITMKVILCTPYYLHILLVAAVHPNDEMSEQTVASAKPPTPVVIPRPAAVP